MRQVKNKKGTSRKKNIEDQELKWKETEEERVWEDRDLRRWETAYNNDDHYFFTLIKIKFTR